MGWKTAIDLDAEMPPEGEAAQDDEVVGGVGHVDDGSAAPPGGPLAGAGRGGITLNAVDEGRGRSVSRRGTASRTAPKPAPPTPTESELHEAAIAAEALMAAMTPGPLPNGGSVDSVRNLKAAESPEKRLKLTSKIPPGGTAAPHFGQVALASSSGHNPRPLQHHPPLFHGSPAAYHAEQGHLVNPPAPASAMPSVPKHEPQHFNLDPEPPWLQGLQMELQTIVQTQKQMATKMRDSGRELGRLQEGIRNLHVGQESLVRRADEQEAALAQMRREFKELEKEVQDLRSAPPTRPVSPVATPRAGQGYNRSNSPRFDEAGQREVNELQLVAGGCNEAKREHMEADVRAMFEKLKALPLLKSIFIAYVRSSFCRIEIVYTDESIWARRKVQSTVLQHLKGLNFQSGIAGQEHARFWFARNRTPHERAKIRAILQTQSLCLKFLAETLVEKDWRGKVWAAGTQVLFHVDRDTRPAQTLMLIDARGNETGWFS